MNCPKCDAELNEKAIEHRKRQACQKCGYMRYENRGWTGGYQELLDEIADEVARTGNSTCLAVGLLNSCFREGPDQQSFQVQLERWCTLHDFNFEAFEGKDVHGKSTQWIRFYRELSRFS